MLALSFDELQLEVQQRETFDQHRCIWKTDNDRCDSVLEDGISLAIIRSILTVSRSELGIEQIQRAGHLSLCSNHDDVECIEDVFTSRWIFGADSSVTPSGPQTPMQRGASGTDGVSPLEHPPTRVPRALSSGLNTPQRIGSTSDTIVAGRADPLLLALTPPPQRAERLGPAGTPPRVADRPEATPLQQSAAPGNASPGQSPFLIASSSSRNSVSRYRYPLFSTIRAEFQNQEIKEYQCIAKRTSGRCKGTINDDNVLSQVRAIMEQARSTLSPDDVRKVNKLLVCNNWDQYEKQRMDIEATWKSEFPDFPDDFGRPSSPENTPSKRKSDSQVPDVSDIQRARNSRQRTNTGTGDNAYSGRSDIHRLAVLASEFSSTGPQGDDTSSRNNAEESEISGESNQPSQKNRFLEAKCSAWAPHKVRSEVTRLFNKPLTTPKVVGVLYLFKAMHSNHVKIGYTLGNWEERKAGIQKSSGIALSDEHSIEDIPHAVLLRLEEVVHTYLAHFRRDSPLKIRSRAQHEWFEIDFQIAKRTAHFWLDKLKEGGKIPAGNGEVSDYDMNEANWPAIHRDHDRRFAIWETAIETSPESELSTLHEIWWRKIGRVWLDGCVAICFAGAAEHRYAMVPSAILAVVWTIFAHSIC